MYPANFPALGRGPFLALMKEKNQKKIKASGTPAKFWDFQRALMYPANFPVLGRGPFLALMKEKNQKKIKASGTPAQFAGYIKGSRRKRTSFSPHRTRVDYDRRTSH